MAAPLSLTAGVALSAQLRKGTAASTTFIRGLAGRSAANERFDVIEAINEHTGVHQRPSTRRTTPLRSGYIVEIAAQWLLRPDMIGHALAMAGFWCVSEAKGTVTQANEIQTVTLTNATGGTFTLTFMGETTAAIAYNASAATVQSALLALSNLDIGDVTVSGNDGGPYAVTFAGAYLNKNVPLMTADGSSLTGTGASVTVAQTQTVAGDYYEHVFTPAKQGFQPYGTLLTALGEAGERFERKVTDCRFNQLQFTAERGGITCDASGFGLSISASAGTETQTAETDILITPATGSLSCQVSSVELVSGVRGHTLTIAQEIAEDDHYLHSFARNDLPVTGFDVTGLLRDVDISYALYKKLRWGSASGTGPVATIPEASLTFSWQSSGNISGLAVPYLFQVSIPYAALFLNNFEASGNNLVRCDIEYRMLDRTTTDPISITVRNLKAAGYGGS